MPKDEKELEKLAGQLSADKQFGMGPEELEHVVRLGQSRMLEDVLTKLNANPSLFTQAMGAAKAQDKEAFVAALQKAGVAPMQAHASWRVIVNIITFQW